MKTKFIQTLLLSLHTLLQPYQLSATELKELDMLRGESRKLSFATVKPPRVSKRDIISLEWLHDETWRLIALKRGVVTIKSYPTAGKTVLWLVRVNGKIKASAHSSPHRSSQKNNPCFGKYMICQNKQQIITGTISNLAEYSKLYSYCQKTLACIFRADLDTKTLRTAKASLMATHNDHIEVKYPSKGPLIFQVNCHILPHKTWQAHIHASLGYTPALKQIICDPYASAPEFAIQMRFFHHSQKQDHSIGTHWQDILYGKAVTPKIFQANLLKHQAKVIGQPKFHLINGHEAHIQAGGELRHSTIDHQGKSQDHWSPLGLITQVKIQDITPNQLKLKIRAKLRVSQGEGHQVLQSSLLETTASIPLHKEVIIGKVDMEVENHHTESMPIIEFIPIIGPIFRHKTTQKNHSGLYISISATPLGDAS